MKVNFKKVGVIDLEGNEVEFDVSKDFANYLYRTTGDLGMLDFAQNLYKNGEVDVDDEMAAILVESLEDPAYPIRAIIKKSIIEKLGHEIKTEKDIPKQK